MFLKSADDDPIQSKHVIEWIFYKIPFDGYLFTADFKLKHFIIQQMHKYTISKYN